MLRLVMAATTVACGRLHFDERRGCVRALAAYGDQVCVARFDGSVACWGDNTRGNLGDGTLTTRDVPAPALISDVVAIGAGEDTVCAAKRDDSLWCWGAGMLGQVGDGAGVDRALPSRVDMTGPFVELRGSETHTCARRANGEARCWGSNVFGEAGVVGGANVLAPAGSQTSGNLAIALGDNFTCLLRPDATVGCFGSNTEGVLGDGTTVARPYASRVAAISDPVVQISAGAHRHTCALTENGGVWCWGNNLTGQLGRAATMYESVPAPVAITDAVQVVAGTWHSCARTVGDEVWCWGRNDFGQLGNGVFSGDVYMPVRTGTFAPIIDLQAATFGTFALLADATVIAWGSAIVLGIGDGVDRATPVEVPLCP